MGTQKSPFTAGWEYVNRLLDVGKSFRSRRTGSAFQSSRARAPAPHNLSSKNPSTLARISGALFDS